jgi:hypothetical protein
VIQGVKLRGKVSALSSMTLKRGIWFSELHTIKKEEVIVLAMSAWNVITSLPTQMPGMMNALHLPDI